MKRFLPVLVLIAAVTGLSLWWFSPRQIVMRRTEKLLEVLTIPEAATRQSRHGGAYSFNALIGKSVMLSNPDIEEANGTFRKDEIETAYSYLANHAKRTHFRPKDWVSAIRHGAEYEIVIDLDAYVELRDRKITEGPHRAAFRWRKDEKSVWRLAGVSWKQW